MDRRVSIDGFDMAVLMRGTVLNAQRGYAAALRDRAKRDMRQANQGDIFLFDGIFLHRPELRDYWDLSIYLDISRISGRSQTWRRRPSPARSGPSPTHGGTFV